MTRERYNKQSWIQMGMVDISEAPWVVSVSVEKIQYSTSNKSRNTVFIVAFIKSRLYSQLAPVPEHQNKERFVAHYSRIPLEEIVRVSVSFYAIFLAPQAREPGTHNIKFLIWGS